MNQDLNTKKEKKLGRYILQMAIMIIALFFFFLLYLIDNRKLEKEKQECAVLIHQGIILHDEITSLFTERDSLLRIGEPKQAEEKLNRVEEKKLQFLKNKKSLKENNCYQTDS